MSRGIAGERSGNQILVDTKGDEIADMTNFVISIPPGKGVKPIYVTVLCVSEDRTITVAWPLPEERTTNLIEPGVPKSIAFEVWAKCLQTPL